jgi:hypothetical protein
VPHKEYRKLWHHLPYRTENVSSGKEAVSTENVTSYALFSRIWDAIGLTTSRDTELICLYSMTLGSRIWSWAGFCHKGRGNVALCFNWAPHHKGVLWDWIYCSTHTLTSALDGGELSASRPGRFTPRERVHSTHWIGGWVGPRSVLDTVVKRKIPSL